MGTTLQNGVYLPNEGERNCYAGLKTNWEILDQKVADVTALQQAVAGALHREIVESLPTTDIDPNTIYMVLSGTSATENVYNEFMYVNNAWELIGTSATDLTNYYTKGEVDGLLLLKANASDLTSHTGDTTIHVTASDKTKWTNSANTHVLRLALSALTPSTSDNSFSNLDDSTALKVGDKVMDTAGVLFEVTAIDTQNSTFTIGTALIDLAQDSDVVHKSGDETISGVKSFINYFLGKDLSGQTVDLNDCVDAYSGAIHYYYAVSNYTNISNKPENKPFILESKTVRYVSSIDYIYYQKIYTADYNASPSIYTRYYRSGSALWTNWIKDTDKFVTTDTAQTVSGSKTFSENLTIYNNDSSQATKNLIIGSSKIQVGDTSTNDLFGINFNAGASYVARVTVFKDTSGTQNLQLNVRTKDNSNNLINSMVRLRLFANGFSTFEPDGNNLVSLGSSSNKWKDCYTSKVNGVEPSSLSLPSERSARIDISSYITNLGNGDTNAYTVPANGYIWLHFTSVTGIICYSQTSSTMTNYAQTFTRSQGDGQLYAFFPVRKDDRFVVQIYTSSTGVVQNAYFIPCQGNV